MKHLEKIYAWGLLVVLAGIVIHTPLTLWLGVQFPEAENWIKSWKEVLLFLLVPLALWLVTDRKLWRVFAKDWLFRLIVAFAALHFLLAALWWHGTNQTLAGIGIDLRFLLFFALVYTLVRVAPQYKKAMVNVATTGAVVIAGFATVQLFLPADILTHIGYGEQTIKPYQTVDENPDYVRVNSTLRGPNPLGAYAAAALAMTAAYIIVRQRKKKKVESLVWTIGLLSAVALWLSYSRSAIVAALIGVAAAVIFGIKKVSSKTWKIGIVVAALLLLFVAVGRETSFVQNVILHDNPTTGAVVTSNDDHVTSLQTGAERLLQQPFGGGVGSTGSASLQGESGIIIENQYLFIAHEVGWLGLLLFICIFGVILWRLFMERSDWLVLGVLSSGVCLALIGLLLPVWTDDAVSLTWWALAAVALGGMHGKSTRKQKTT